MSTTTPPKLYEVTDQQYGTQYNPDGTSEGVWTVFLTFENGVNGQITVPDSAYTPTVVHDLATKQARNVIAIGRLPVGA